MKVQSQTLTVGLLVLSAITSCTAFTTNLSCRHQVLTTALSSTNGDESIPTPSLDELKSKLVSTCAYQPTLTEVESCIARLEDKAEEVRTVAEVKTQ